MNYEDITDRYAVRAIDACCITADIDGVKVEGHNIPNLTKNVNMYLNGNVDALVINHMCRLTDEKGWDIQEAIDHVAETFEIDECDVDTIWIDYITSN